MMYDFLIVGAGLSGAVCADVLTNKGYSVRVIERREHIGGNIYTEKQDGITVHKYGAHIFHTDSKRVWDYITKFCEMADYRHKVVAYSDGRVYSLPFNMNTFAQLWGGIRTPADAKRMIYKQVVEREKVESVEDYALSTVGIDIYEKLIRGYTRKQWGAECSEISKDVLKRIPLRFTYNDDYFTDRYQGIPKDGYTEIIKKMLARADVQTGVEYDEREAARNVIYTGAIDELCGYKFGALPWRSLDFYERVFDTEDYQGIAVMNYTGNEEWTRIIEHKHFLGEKSGVSVVTFEYPRRWEVGKERYYPIENSKSKALYERYRDYIGERKKNFYFVGRLAEYKYYDMDDCILNALKFCEQF